ncbi:MAG: CDP-archaeol synthase [Nanoarchaeota archaeon]
MLSLIVQSVYYFLPAYVANMAPIIFRRLLPSSWAVPVDGGLMFRGKPVLGRNKTWRGLVLGVVSAAVVAVLQRSVGWTYAEPFPYASFSWQMMALLGVLLGAGALIGDMVKSFFKRQTGRPPGRPWVPFDQVDFVVGALLLSSILFVPSWRMIVTILVASFALNMIVPFIGYRLGVNEAKF